MNSFTNLGVSPELVAAVEKLGFVSPTPIQEQAIPVLLDTNRDFIGLASTGTGKTAAFGLPLLQLIDASEKRTQGLIIAPTRELCNQIANDLKNFSVHLPALSVVAVYGGASIETQIRELKRGAQVIVATPGRLIDLIDRGAARIENADLVILDEADEMLNMGFQEDIDAILSSVQEERRTWLFSATMPAAVRNIAKNYMEDPFELTVGTKNASNANIDNQYYLVKAKDRFQALKRIVDYNPGIFGIIFTRTKIEAQDIAEKMLKEGYDADALHGDLSQAQRDRVMARYRDRSLQLLVATDVAARGIDVDNVTHVINYGLPDELEVYTHRSGRTARAGKKGICISIIHAKEQGKIRQLEKLTKAQFTKNEIPGGKEICGKQLFNFISKVKNAAVNEKEMEDFLPAVYAELEDFSKEEIIKLFVSSEFNRFLSYYKNAEDINHSDLSDGKERTGKRGGFDRLFVGLGELDDFDKPRMLKFINSLKLGRIEVGRIEIKRSFSFIEIESAMSAEFMERLNSMTFDGRPVKAEPAGERGDSGSDRPFKKSRGKDRGKESPKTERERSKGRKRAYSN
jgi:ATP-dependent RNA helicase DeaD